MAYNRFLKPRFYTDSINWQASRGWSKASELALEVGSFNSGYSIYDAFDLNPFNLCSFDTSSGTTHQVLSIDQAVSARPVTFVAILNHNLNTAEGKIRIAHDTSAISTAGGGSPVGGTTVVFGGSESGGIVTPDSDGDILITFTESGDRYWSIEFQDDATWSATDLTVGAIIIGEYYTMPHSPDQSIEHGFMTDGISVQETVGGKRYANANWVRGNDETYQANYMPFRRATGLRQMPGREYFSCSFSFLADTDMLPSNMKITGDTDDFAYDVFNKLNWQQFPCIFTPDSTSTTEGDYMFGRLAGNSFSLTQQAHNLYSTGFRIEQEF